MGRIHLALTIAIVSNTRVDKNLMPDSSKGSAGGMMNEIQVDVLHF